MIGSVISVTYLGQGIGNSVIQAKIIVRYEEIDGELISPYEGLCTTHRIFVCLTGFNFSAVECGESSITKRSTIRELFASGSYRHLLV